MSEVVCFRLDRDNPREAQALEVLRAWQETGFSRRHVLTEALLKLDGDAAGDASDAIAELRAVLDRAHDLLEGMRDGRYTSSARRDEGQDEAQLTESFIASVRDAARSGMKQG